MARPAQCRSALSAASSPAYAGAAPVSRSVARRAAARASVRTEAAFKARAEAVTIWVLQTCRSAPQFRACRP